MCGLGMYVYGSVDSSGNGNEGCILFFWLGELNF